MKAKFLKLLMLLVPFVAFAQGAVVFDPTQAANMSEQIANTSKQISQFEKSLEYMQKAEDKLSQVSGYVRDVEDLRKIAKMYKESINLAQKIRNDIPKIKNPATQKYYISVVSETLASLNNSVVFINNVLKSNFFKMTDKERMDLISKERSRVFLKKSKLVGLTL